MSGWNESSVAVRSMRIASVAMVAAAAVLGLLWSQTRGMLQLGSDVEITAQAYVISLNEDVKAFTGDAENAYKANRKLSVSESAFQALSERASTMPAPFVAKRYQRAVKSYSRVLGEYYARVSETAKYVVDRAGLMDEVVRSLQEVSKPGSDESVVIKRIATAEEAARRTGEGIGSLDKASRAAYQGEGLREWLKSLEDGLRSLRTGLEKKDTASVASAADTLAKVMQSDWSSLFYEADKGNIAELDESLKAVDEARDSVVAARASTMRAQGTYGILAFVLLLAGAALAAIAWLR